MTAISYFAFYSEGHLGDVILGCGVITQLSGCCFWSWYGPSDLMQTMAYQHGWGGEQVIKAWRRGFISVLAWAKQLSFLMDVVVRSENCCCSSPWGSPVGTAETSREVKTNGKRILPTPFSPFLHQWLRIVLFHFLCAVKRIGVQYLSLFESLSL